MPGPVRAIFPSIGLPRPLPYSSALTISNAESSSMFISSLRERWVLAALVLYGQNEGEAREYPRPAVHIYEHKHKEEGTWRFLTESCWPG